MKNRIGLIKEIDGLGRIVIPKEIRSLYGFGEGVELVLLEQGVLIRNPEYRLTRRTSVGKRSGVKEK